MSGVLRVMGGRGAFPNPAGELTALLGPHSWCAWGCCPLPKNPNPDIGLRS